MVWILVSFLFVSLFFFGLYSFSRANTAFLARLLKRFLIAGLLVVVSLVLFRLALSGGLHFLWLGLLGLFPFVKRYLAGMMAAHFFSHLKGRFGEGRARKDGGLTEEEARHILGLSGDIDEEIINRAWKKKIALAHPDQGGSIEEAQRVNQARDLLKKIYKN